MARINNEFRLTGRLGADIEIVRPEGRDPIGKVSIAVDNGYRDRDSGDYVESTVWMDLTFYNQSMINRLEKYSGKGHEVSVMGTLGRDTWESKTRTKGDGSPAIDSKVTLTVTSLSLGRKPKGQDGGAQAPAGGFDEDDQNIPF